MPNLCSRSLTCKLHGFTILSRRISDYPELEPEASSLLNSTSSGGHLVNNHTAYNHHHHPYSNHHHHAQLNSYGYITYGGGGSDATGGGAGGSMGLSNEKLLRYGDQLALQRLNYRVSSLISR